MKPAPGRRIVCGPIFKTKHMWAQMLPRHFKRWCLIHNDMVMFINASLLFGIWVVSSGLIASQLILWNNN